MLCRKLVIKEQAREVSVEHVDPRKIYAVIVPELSDPMLIRLDEDAGKIYCANLSARPWTAHTEDSNPTDEIPQAAIARYINHLLKEKGRSVYEFSTLLEFCSWLVDLKQGRVDVTAPDVTAPDEEAIKPAYTEEKEDAKPLGKKSYVKVQDRDRSDGTVHYASKQNHPVCGSTLTWPNNWGRVNKPVTCLKCVRVMHEKSTAYYNIATKRSKR